MIGRNCDTFLPGFPNRPENLASTLELITLLKLFHADNRASRLQRPLEPTTLIRCDVIDSQHHHVVTLDFVQDHIWESADRGCADLLDDPTAQLWRFSYRCQSATDHCPESSYPTVLKCCRNKPLPSTDQQRIPDGIAEV